MRKLIHFVSRILPVLGVGVLAYMGVSLLSAAYFNHKANKLQGGIAKQSAIQDEIFWSITGAFLEYEMAVSDYEKAPTPKKLAELAATTEKLNQLLDKTSTVHGLSVKRWVDRFNVWQYQFGETLRQSGNSKKLQTTGSSEVLFYENKINSAISDAEKKYRHNTYNDLLYTPHFATALHSLTKKIEKIYEGEAKTLIPQAIRELQQKAQSTPLTACTGPSSSFELTPKNVADNIVFLQYQSRYCPFTVSSTTEALCYQLTHTPILENKQILVFCQIAEARQQAAMKNAAERYGKLSFAEYYQKYVAPLVPSYKMKLINRVNANKNKSLFEVCNQEMQPVVPYRDPEVDAQTAAYVLYGSEVCKDQYLDLEKTDN